MRLPGGAQDRRGRTDAADRRPDGTAAQKGGQPHERTDPRGGTRARRSFGRRRVDILPTSCATCAGAGTSTCRSSRSGASPMCGSSSMRRRGCPCCSTGRPACPTGSRWLVHGPIRCSAATSSSSRSRARRKADYPGLRGQPFFKIVRGLPGDAVTVPAGTCRSTASRSGSAKTQAYDRRPLAPIAPTVIPPGHYYVQGTSPDSFDSRYRSSGLVRAEQVIGRRGAAVLTEARHEASHRTDVATRPPARRRRPGHHLRRLGTNQSGARRAVEFECRRRRDAARRLPGLAAADRARRRSRCRAYLAAFQQRCGRSCAPASCAAPFPRTTAIRCCWG
jgi:type IV secretory pathway protease TraF